MAIKRGSKVDKSFSNAAMSDLMFLLLVFMIIATTLINTNAAVKLDLPDDDKNHEVVTDKEMTVVSVQLVEGAPKYYVNSEPVEGGMENVEAALAEKMSAREDKTFSLRCDKGVAIDEVVKMMLMARKHQFRLLLATDIPQSK